MIKLKLSKELYSEKDIRKSVSDFSQLADFEVYDDYGLYIVIISNCKYEQEETASEFENYLIELTYGSMKNNDF